MPQTSGISGFVLDKASPRFARPSYLGRTGVDIALLEEPADNISLVVGLDLGQGGQHDGRVASLVLLVDISRTRVKHQVNNIHVTVRDSVV